MKKSYKAIMFDLDGTLLPMDMNEFTNGYFADLYKRLNTDRISEEDFKNAVWKGTYAMMKNDGSRTNRDAFWDTFEKVTGISGDEIDPVCIDFYSHEFKAAKRFTQDNPLARKAVEISHEKAPLVVLSTNPLFPEPGQKTRLEWLGLTYDDFDLVTSYETECLAKPNPEFFFNLLRRLDLKPEECLVAGNDEKEDMWCAAQAGIDSYLITDTMIAREGFTWTGDRGTFKEFVKAIENLEPYK